jgi:hypothetical protein
MLSSKDHISMNDSEQYQNLSYHFKEAVSLIEETRKSLLEAHRGLLQILTQLTEIKGDLR